MNKSELISDVAGTAGVSRQDVEKVIDAFFDTVRSAVGTGDRVAWPSFGSFSAADRQARTGRNPSTGEAVAIPASRAVKFSASTALKAALNPKPAKAAKKSSKSSPAKSAPAKKSSPAKTAPAKQSPTAKKSSSGPTKTASKAPAKRTTKKASK